MAFSWWLLTWQLLTVVTITSSAPIRGYFDYMADGVHARGYVAYDSTRCTPTSKCPAVVLVHDWNGLNDYEKERACMLSDQGYVAFAADIYGTSTPVATMLDWIAASSLHRQNATKYYNKIHAALETVLTFHVVDPARLGAVGYCFGGTGMVNLALAGHAGVNNLPLPAGLSGVVSFHGGIQPTSRLQIMNSTTRPKLLLESGGKDETHEDIGRLLDELESGGVNYEISRYGPGVGHAFTEWHGPLYDQMADSRSWASALRFFDELFAGKNTPVPKPSTTTEAGLPSQYVNYTVDGVTCQGYLQYNSSLCTASTKCPAVVIVHDWDGLTQYEIDRAYLVAKMGYVVFAADVYGLGTPVMTEADWAAASSAHRENMTNATFNKMVAAMNQVSAYGFVDTTKMAAIGYGFGGIGAVNLALAGHGGARGVPTALLGVVSHHGGVAPGHRIAAESAASRPKLLLESGGKADSNADIATLLDELEGVGASYEVSRLGSNVYQCFTEWGAAAPGVCEYSAHADLRSWMETKAFLTEIFSGGATGTHQTTNCTGDCSRCSGHGKCYYVPGPAPANVTGNNTNATPYDPVVCRCDPEWFDVEHPHRSCALGPDHVGIPVPPTTMGPNWLQFTTGSGMSAVMNAMFQVRLSGYRAAFPESLPKMQVKVSEYYGHCAGAANPVATVDRDSATAELPAPGAAGTYSLCAKWRTDFELLVTAAGAPLNLTVTGPLPGVTLHGYETCEQYLKAKNMTDMCGCFLTGTTATHAKVGNAFQIEGFKTNPNPPTIYTGCCSPYVPQHPHGNTTQMKDWGVCHIAGMGLAMFS